MSSFINISKLNIPPKSELKCFSQKYFKLDLKDSKTQTKNKLDVLVVGTQLTEIITN